MDIKSIAKLVRWHVSSKTFSFIEDSEHLHNVLVRDGVVPIAYFPKQVWKEMIHTLGLCELELVQRWDTVVCDPSSIQMHAHTEVDKAKKSKRHRMFRVVQFVLFMILVPLGMSLIVTSANYDDSDQYVLSIIYGILGLVFIFAVFAIHLIMEDVLKSVCKDAYKSAIEKKVLQLIEDGKLIHTLFTGRSVLPDITTVKIVPAGIPADIGNFVREHLYACGIYKHPETIVIKDRIISVLSGEIISTDTRESIVTLGDPARKNEILITTEFHDAVAVIYMSGVSVEMTEQEIHKLIQAAGYTKVAA